MSHVFQRFVTLLTSFIMMTWTFYIC